MLMLMSRAASTVMTSVEVNWLPWPALNISGVPRRASASFTASMEPASKAIDAAAARMRPR